MADAVVRTLHELGVDTFYGIPGGAISSVYDALLDVKGVRVINTRHETGAVFMAMGHSRTGGSFPCVLTTSGPGVTNALTGLAAAHADGIPLILIAGEVPKRNFGRGALQEGSRYELDVLGMCRSVSKFSAELSNPRAAASVVRRAVATALSGRQGPVFLSLPLDVANERVMPTRASVRVSTTFEPDEETVLAAALALADSERGLILVGSGARHPEAVGLLREIAGTLQMPVATTPKAKGLYPESDRFSLGVFGLGGHRSAAEYVEGGLDVLFCVGCGLGEPGTNSWSTVLQPSRAFIQIDIDAAQIGRNYHVDYGLVGPAHILLRALAERLPRRPRLAARGGVRYYEAAPRSEMLQPAQVLRLVQERLPAEAIFTTDIGEHALYALHYLRIGERQSFLINTGFGSMGSGIGMAIGAKVANPERPVVSFCGDFGFQMYGMDLATCVDDRIGVIFAVLNNSRMKMVEGGQTRVFGRSGCMHGRRVDFAALAHGLGAHGHTIREPEDLDRVPEAHFRSGLPCVLDFEVSPAAVFPVNARVAEVRHFNGN